MNEHRSRDRIGICPACKADHHFQSLPKIGKAFRCPNCNRWLKVSSRLPIRFELYRPNRA